MMFQTATTFWIKWVQVGGAGPRLRKIQNVDLIFFLFHFYGSLERKVHKCKKSKQLMPHSTIIVYWLLRIEILYLFIFWWEFFYFIFMAHIRNLSNISPQLLSSCYFLVLVECLIWTSICDRRNIDL